MIIKKTSCPEVWEKSEKLKTELKSVESQGVYHWTITMKYKIEKKNPKKDCTAKGI